MTVILNNPACATLGGNTGIPGCAFDPKNIEGCMIVEDDLVIANANLGAAFVAYAQALTLASIATRAYPIFKFESTTDNTEDITIKSYGHGGKAIAKEGKYDLTFEMVKGGHCHNSQLRTFNGIRNKKVLLFDKDYNVLGVKSGTDSMMGFSLDFIYAYPFKFDTGEEPAGYRLRMAFSNVKEFNEDLVWFNLGSNPADAFKGILDVELYMIANIATKATIGVRTKCGKVSLYGEYSTDLDVAGLWVVTKAGAAVVPTGVVAVPGVGPELEGGWELTFTTPTGAHLFHLTTAALLAAAGVGGAPDTGYEEADGLTLTLTT